MPLWKLQTVGGERLDFLYENVGRGARITLKPGVTRVYDRYSYDKDKREALDAWGARVQAIITADKPTE